MSYLTEGYYSDSVAGASEQTRTAFIQRTYTVLALSVLAFVGIETVLVQSILSGGVGADLMKLMLANKLSWIVLMALFVGGGFVAQMMANSASRSTQYMGLALFIGIECLFFLPILTICEVHPKLQAQRITLQAAIMTLVVFGGLTAYVFISKKDFSFLGGFLVVMGLLSLGLVIFAVLFGMNLGMWFSGAMIALASLYILYDTSNVLHHYREDQHVPAALALFSSLAMLFYYILRYLMQYALASEE